MALFKNESEMFEMMKNELYTPVVGDILDAKGYCHQFLPPQIQPLTTNMKLAGKAMPVLMIDVFEEQTKPFGRLTAALDQLEKNEVYIANGGTQRCAYWGEMLTAAAKSRGAVGAVVNSWHRDTPQVLEQNFSVFSWGRFAQDSRVRTRVVDYRCRIEMEKVSISTGDIIFGDLDGVLVIPKEIAPEVICESIQKAREEKSVRQAIEAGMSATAALAKYGIL